ncbi:daunorubicin resistance transmembrane protein, putative [Heliomicrobium modesticaldum Ice1]|uniref:Transport permease protein n=1 Tax=Heliobacterium modesticaldum (strain ATCC 51547 / Ice1) TaxID=498761 RepID=B0TG96_HELMI|nr:daunorubicin resistance transmembrane protein, putative [Heliomicrobium modesticaldum Ice1]
MENVLKTIYVIWRRELLRFIREKSQWAGMILQPTFYLTFVGTGIAASMRFRIAPEGADVSYMTFIYPGIIAMSVLFTAMSSGISIIWDREFGFLKEILVAPVPRWAISVGKALGIGTIVCFQGVVLLCLSPLAGVPITIGKALLVLPVCALIGFSIGLLGLSIAGRMESMQGFQLISNFLTMPMFFLSGAMYPMQSAPSWLQWLMRVDPLTYGVDALRNIIYKGIPEAAVMLHHSLAVDVAALSAFAFVTAVTGLTAFNRQG